MMPEPCARIVGSTARMPKKTPLKLVSAACAQARGSTVAIGPIGSMTPALLISASIRPKASRARATAACDLGELGDVAGHRLGLAAGAPQPGGERGDRRRPSGRAASAPRPPPPSPRPPPRRCRGWRR